MGLGCDFGDGVTCPGYVPYLVGASLLSVPQTGTEIKLRAFSKEASNVTSIKQAIPECAGTESTSNVLANTPESSQTHESLKA